MKLKPARAGALALALTSLPAYAANDAFTVNGAPLVATAPGNYLPATAAYFANGLFSASNPAYIQGSFSATLSGFAPAGAYASLTASTTSASVTLPAGTTVVVYNYGATPAFVKLGVSGVVATTANDVIQPGGAQAFTVGANTYLAGVTSSGSTSLNISGGSGLPMGWGGGSTAGGGGGTVAQGAAASASGAWPVYVALGGSAVSTSNGFPVSPATGALWAFNAQQWGGATLGAASAWGTAPSGNVQGVNANVLSSALPSGAATSALQSSILTALGSPFQAGGAIANTSFGATQSGAWTVTANQGGSPWADNIAQFGGSSVQTGTGASGAGVPRVTVSNDSFVNPVGAANITSAQASIGTSAALVVAARTGAPGAGRIAATFYNAGAVTVYLGPSGVTTTTGFALAPGATFTFSTTASFYGVVASGTATLSVLETY